MHFIISQVVLVCDSVKHINIDTETTNSIQHSLCYKILWLLLSFVLGIFAIALVILFFVFFGCCYEFVKCYTSKKTVNVDDDSFNESIQHTGTQEEEVPKSNLTIFFLIVAGVLCQPLYLVFYILYGLMEFYRRFNCWFYYIDV